MPRKRYIVELTSEERRQLKDLISTGKTAAYKQRHARILLHADSSRRGPAMTDDQIASAVGCGRATVERLRQRFVTEGFDAALDRHKAQRVWARLIDGRAEARLIALTCSQPPKGYGRWTLRLLAQRMVALEVVDHCSKDTVHRVLKKTSLNLG